MKLLKEKIIRIGDKEYPLKMSIRSMIEFEEMSGHSITSLGTLRDVTILFYCTIKAGGADMTYEEFMNVIDEKPDILNEFSQLVIEPSEKKAPDQ